MANNIVNENRKAVVEEIRELSPVDAFLAVVALKERMLDSEFEGFWKLMRIS